MEKVKIIAEAGVNHNGDLDIAKKLVKAAKNAGADFIKFQTFTAENLVTRSAEKAHYQKINCGDDLSHFEMLKKLELSDIMHKELYEYCDTLGIKFLSSPFDNEGIEYLKHLGLSIIKVPSGEITNLPYLKRIGESFKNIILSTGTADIKEVKWAYKQIIGNNGNNNVAILHCTTEYPAPFEEVNLNAMLHMKNELGVEVGYSDHTIGIEVPIAAVAIGATIIEKHFTLDKNLPGPDHKASLDPNELKQLVGSIRNVEKAISGDGFKNPTPSEIKNKAVIRKSIHVSKPLKKGHTLESEDLIFLRPGDGLSPAVYESVIGKVVKVDLNEYHKLSWNDLLK